MYDGAGTFALQVASDWYGPAGGGVFTGVGFGVALAPADGDGSGSDSSPSAGSPFATGQP
jgi:hypothetical protein